MTEGIAHAPADQRRRGLSRAAWPSAASNTCSPMPAPISRRSSRPMPRRRIPGLTAPKPVIATHENVAISMAHGYAIASRQGAGGDGACQRRHRQRAVRRVQRGARQRADPVHRRPLAADRGGRASGARDTYIHWAQEMFDQAGMLREIVKWEYELRNGDAARNRDRPRPVDRDQRAGGAGLSVAAARGAGRAVAPALPTTARRAAPPSLRPAPTKRRSTEAAALLATAKRPADHHRQRRARPRRRSRRSPNSPSASRSRWSSTASGICRCRPTTRAISATTRRPFVKEADAILVLECDVPWVPSRGRAAGRMPGDPYRRRSALRALSDPRFSLRCRDHRRAAAGAAEARRGAEGALTAESPTRRDAPRRAPRGAARRLAKAARGDGGADADPPVLGQPLPQRGARRRTRSSSTSTRCSTSIAPRLEPRLVFRVEPGGRARLGRWRGAGRQARATRAAGDFDPRRRLLHLLEPGRGTSRVDDAQAAGADRRHQQRDVGRGAARDARHVPGRRGGAQQQARRSSTSTTCRPSRRSARRRAATASGSRTRRSFPPR